MEVDPGSALALVVFSGEMEKGVGIPAAQDQRKSVCKWSPGAQTHPRPFRALLLSVCFSGT